MRASGCAGGYAAAMEGRAAEGDLGQPMPAFELPLVHADASPDQQSLNASALAGQVAVVMFICNHCPYVKAIEDRMIGLAREFEGRGVRFVGICANDAASYPDDAPAALAARARQKGYGFPYLHDATQTVARAFGAVCTPEFFVYDRAGRLAYRGRLDDSWKEPAKVTRRELAAAIEAALAGSVVEGPQRPALGCGIKWRAG
jgi:thiol-disulfide isomerase/thioredoxin